MLHLSLPNNRQVAFRWVASAGAFGFAGRDEGHGLARLWKLPFRWCGLLKTSDFAFFTKTLTFSPRAGNLRFWRPWRAVQSLGGSSLVNAVGLTNPGVFGWLKRYAPLCQARGFKTFVSLHADTTEKMADMVSAIDAQCRDWLCGYELDVSCPSVGTNAPGSTKTAQHCLDLFLAARDRTKLPIGLKYGAQQPIAFALQVLDGQAAWYHLINAAPWAFAVDNGIVFDESPLQPYGYAGGVSGRLISLLSRDALATAMRRPRVPDRTPIISGGGVMTGEEAALRFTMGAAAVGLGTVFLLRPWAVAGLIRKAESRLRNPAAPISS